MKRLITILLCLIAFNSLYSQEPDFLKKYSYQCVLYQTFDQAKYIIGTKTATCFFYKKNAKTYVVSNYHVFGGYNPLFYEYELPLDSIKVRYMDNHNKLRSLRVTPSKKAEPFHFYDKPDIKALLVKLPKGIKVNYINEVIDTAFFEITPKNVTFYGFPSVKNFKINEIFVGNFITGNIYNLKPSDRFNDSTAIRNIKLINNTMFLIDNKGKPGMSGSPVFAEFLINDIITYRFFGVFTGHTENPDGSQIIKAKQAYQYLNELH